MDWTTTFKTVDANRDSRESENRDHVLPVVLATVTVQCHGVGPSWPDTETNRVPVRSLSSSCCACHTWHQPEIKLTAGPDSCAVHKSTAATTGPVQLPVLSMPAMCPMAEV